MIQDVSVFQAALFHVYVSHSDHFHARPVVSARNIGQLQQQKTNVPSSNTFEKKKNTFEPEYCNLSPRPYHSWTATLNDFPDRLYPFLYSIHTSRSYHRLYPYPYPLSIVYVAFFQVFLSIQEIQKRRTLIAYNCNKTRCFYRDLPLIFALSKTRNTSL